MNTRRYRRRRNEFVSPVLQGVAIGIVLVILLTMCALWIRYADVFQKKWHIETEHNDIVYIYNRSKEPQPVQWHTEAEIGTQYMLTKTDSIKFSCVQIWFDDSKYTTEVILSVDGIFDVENLVLEYDDYETAKVSYPDRRISHEGYSYTFIYIIPAYIESVKAKYTWQGRDISLFIENTEIQPDYFSPHALEKAGVNVE